MLGCEHMCSEYIAQLTSLEKQVILKLAKEGPLCGYDFHLGGKKERKGRKALMSSGYWNKVLKHLGSKGPKGLALIAPIQLRNYSASDQRGRRKDIYWLTPKGMLVALQLGVNAQDLIRQVQRIKPKDANTIKFLELTDILGVELATQILEKGKITYEIKNEDTVVIHQEIVLGKEKIQRLEKLFPCE